MIFLFQTSFVYTKIAALVVIWYEEADVHVWINIQIVGARLSVCFSACLDQNVSRIFIKHKFSLISALSHALDHSRFKEELYFYLYYIFSTDLQNFI